MWQKSRLFLRIRHSLSCLCVNEFRRRFRIFVIVSKLMSSVKLSSIWIGKLICFVRLEKETNSVDLFLLKQLQDGKLI